MNRISEKFSELKNKRIAIIPYITVGCPDLETSYDLVIELEKAGADIIELGVAFSDPLADGIVIQQASKIACEQNITLRKVLNFISKLRKKTNIPIALLSYYNPIFVFGLEKFVKTAKEVGVDGIIIPDLPIEEASPIKQYADKENISMIFLLAPTSGKSRAIKISSMTTGFIYYVSITGTTGVREKILPYVEEDIRMIKEITNKPICVGFGVSKPEHIKYLSKFADGAIIGSALVELTFKKEKKEVIKETINFFKYLTSYPNLPSR